MRAIVRQPSEAIRRCELSHRAREPIDLALALVQHGRYVETLSGNGVAVRVLPPEPDLPDAVFVEDTAIVLDECAVVTRPGAESRRPETIAVASVLAEVRAIVTIDSPGTLDGGDVLRVGRTLFVGQTARTNAEGTRQLADAVAPHGYEVVPAGLRGCLHLKSAVTFAGLETVVVNPDRVDAGLFARWQCVPVPPEEPDGANVLLVGDVVYVAGSAPRTRRKLDALGFQTEPMDTSEFEKAEGALTCLSLLFE